MTAPAAVYNTFTTVQPLLKYQYAEDELMRLTLNRYSFAYDHYYKTSEGITKDPSGGYRFYMPLQTGDEEGLGTRGPGKKLETAQGETFDHFEGGLFRVYIRGGWDGDADEMTREERYAFGPNPTSQMVKKRLAKSFAKNLGQMFHRDGSGALFRVSSATGDGTNATLTAYGNHLTSSGYTFGGGTSLGAGHFSKGTALSFFSDVTRAGNLGIGFKKAEKRDADCRVVSSADGVTIVVTPDISANLNGGGSKDYAVRHVNDDGGVTTGEDPGINPNNFGAAAGTAMQLELSGLGAHMNAHSKTVVHGIDKSTDYWAVTPTGTEGSATAFSWTSHVLAPMRTISNRLGADRADSEVEILCSPAMLDRVASDFDGFLKTDMPQWTKAYGYDSVEARRNGVGCKVWGDVDSAEGTLRFVDRRVVQWFETQGFHTRKINGGEDRFVADFDKYETIGVWIGELVMKNPAGLAVVYGLSTS